MPIQRTFNNFRTDSEGGAGRTQALPVSFDLEVEVPSSPSVYGASGNLNLWIKLKVKLVKRNPNWIERIGGASLPSWATDLRSIAPGYRYAEWPEDRWDRFCASFYGNRFWDQKFWLQPTRLTANSVQYIRHSDDLLLASYPRLSDSPGIDIYSRNISCRFNMRPESSSPHRTINVVYIVDSSGNPVSLVGDRGPGGSDLSHYHSDYENLNENDILEASEQSFHDTPARRRPTMSGSPTSASSRPIRRFRYTVANHEIGHMIGLHHIGIEVEEETCIGIVNAGGHDRMCYFGRDITDESNVMGHGNEVSWHNAYPWRIAWRYLTNIRNLDAFTVHSRPIYPFENGYRSTFNSRDMPTINQIPAVR